MKDKIYFLPLPPRSGWIFFPHFVRLDGVGIFFLNFILLFCLIRRKYCNFVAIIYINPYGFIF